MKKITPHFAKMGFRSVRELEIAIWALYALFGKRSDVADLLECTECTLAKRLRKPDHVVGYWLRLHGSLVSKKEIIAHVRARYEAGESVRQIAEASGFTPTTIRSYLKKAGIRLTPGGANYVRHYVEHEGERITLAEYARRTNQNFKHLYYLRHILPKKPARAPKPPKPHCIECGGEVVKIGRNSAGNQQYRCKTCGANRVKVQSLKFNV